MESNVLSPKAFAARPAGSSRDLSDPGVMVIVAERGTCKRAETPEGDGAGTFMRWPCFAGPEMLDLQS